MSNRKVAVFTGSRAEYGLLVPVIRAIEAAPDLDLLLIASGDHVANDAEAVPVAAQVSIRREDETAASTPRAIGRGVIAVTEELERLAPDLVVIYGDRFEAFAALIAATQMSIPTAHLEGGDLTEGGTLDDVVRHAMSKLAHVHFPTNEAAAERLRAMGEEPWRIHTAGFPPIDLIRAGDYAPRAEVLETLGLDPARPIVLFTLHPISTSPLGAGEEISTCLAALQRAKVSMNAQLVLTYPNGDVGSDQIIKALKQFEKDNPEVVLRPSLGRRLYHGLLKICGDEMGVCLGNSSSGVKETGAFQCPAIDIGPRQSGRLRGGNVLNVPVREEAIFEALEKGFNPGFRAVVADMENPYGQGNTGPLIAGVLSALDLASPALVVKKTRL